MARIAHARFGSSVGFSLAAMSAVAGCLPSAASGGSSSSPYGPPVAATVGDDTGAPDDNFAAMDEVPVAGGELRLAAPRRTQDAAGGIRTAIAFPLRHTDATAKVSGMSAMYTVTQTFENPYDEPLDAVYAFPLGAGAAVIDYAIAIGERTIAGVIKRKAEARAVYDEARAQGHTAALLEQDRANVFRQRIANLAPRETISVRLQYIELLGYRDGQYELAFPLVVGPRYLPADGLGRAPVGAHRAGDPARPGVASIPYADARVAGSTVSFAADIDAGVPVQAVTSSSHQVVVEDAGPTRRRVALAGAAELPNRDVVIRYRTAADQTMVGLLAHRSDARGYFTLIVQPKASYRTGDIAPREVMIAVDTSGSMSGQPIAQAQRLAGALIDSLRPGDTFNVLAFSGGTAAMAPAAIPGDAIGKQTGKAFVAQLASGGGTEMGTAMVRALATRPGEDRIRLVYLLTDGFVGNDDAIVSAARHNLGANRIFSVGIGSAPNRALLDQVAAVGRGYASYLGPSDSAGDLAEDLVRRTAFPYLTDVQIDWNGLAVSAITPAAIPDVYAGMPLVVSGVYARAGRAKVTVSATTAGHRVQIPVDIALPERVDAAPVAALWARKRIDELLVLAGDGIPGRTESQITELGLQFHMVTDYTSFVAVDRTRVVVAGGARRFVEQPALAPAGVNLDMAVGRAAGSEVVAVASRGEAPHSGGGWSGGGGGDVDPLTLILALALVPLAVTLRRARA